MEAAETLVAGEASEREARRRLRRGKGGEVETDEGSWVFAGVSGWMASGLEGFRVVLV